MLSIITKSYKIVSQLTACDRYNMDTLNLVSCSINKIYVIKHKVSFFWRGLEGYSSLQS